MTAGVGTAAAGTVTAWSFHSPTLGEVVHANVYLPPGYRDGTGRYPVLYLLHGRGDTMAAWTRATDRLDRLIGRGIMPPAIAVLPDAPWSSRASWYVDSSYTGPDPGRPVESAFTADLVPAADTAWRTVPHRTGRLVGGYSMGGAGALRLALAHQALFASALVLSPAIYTPLPPAHSNTRAHGAFGRGAALFDDQVYRALNYPAQLCRVDPRLPLRVFIAAGNREPAHPDPAEARHNADAEAQLLSVTLSRVPGITVRLRIMDGGHDWDLWSPAFADGMTELGPHLATAAPGGGA